MEEPTQNKNLQTISAVVIVLLVLGAGYFLFQKYKTPADIGNQEPMVVVVENTQMINGVIAAPAGFPQDIPFEKGHILESAVTRYPEQNAKQLSVSYQSPKTVAQKYAEYKNYMGQAGYTITEGDPNAPVRAIFGTKTDANLSVVISNPDDITLVQLSYLLKSAGE